MKILKKIFNFVFNPLNNVSFGKSTEKIVGTFREKPALIFLAALLVSAIVLLCGYYFF